MPNRTNGVNAYNHVLYVEPNLVHSIDGTDGYTYETTPPMEDYCVVVNLGVTIQGKRYVTQVTTEDKQITATWNATQGKVNFMQGTRMYYDSKNKSGEYIDSLTTNYAEMSPREYLDNEGESNTAEMFGIESIDINYDNYYVPQVTIKFIDIRGMSLFMPEELRHRNSQGNLSGLADNDIAGSFFKSFFTFPYPKFDLMVKGIYGKPVTYELTVVDWKATFDCTRGSFGAIVNFIGYSYALLSDITLNAVIAAPESDYDGRNYFETNNSFVYHEGVKIKTFREFWESYKTAKEEAEKVSASSNLVKDQQAYRQIIDDVLEPLMTELTNFINVVDNKAQKYKNSKSIKIVSNPASYFNYILFSEENVDLNGEQVPNEIKKDKNSLFDLLTDSRVVSILPNASSCFQYWGDKSINIKNNDKVKEIITLGDEDNKFKSVCIFLGSDLATSIAKKIEEYEEEIRKIQEILAKNEAEIIKRTLGFSPDIENFIRMICAHVDTLLHSIHTAANSASTSQDRKLKGANKSTDFTGNKVPAFPKVTERRPVKDPDNINDEKKIFEKIQDAWIGEIMDGNCPEAELVNGLLNGAKLIGRTMQKVEPVVTQDINYNENTVKDLSIPFLPFDFLLGKFLLCSKNEEIEDNNEIINRLLLRGFIASAIVGVDSNNMSLLGKADAINFYNLTSNVAQNFKNKLDDAKNRSQSYIDSAVINDDKWLTVQENNVYLTPIQSIQGVVLNDYFRINKHDNNFFSPLSDLTISNLKDYNFYSGKQEDVITHNILNSGRHSRYVFAILNDEEANEIYNTYTNHKTFGDANDDDAYESLYDLSVNMKDAFKPKDEWLKTYYNKKTYVNFFGNSKDTFKNIHEKAGTFLKTLYQDETFNTDYNKIFNSNGHIFSVHKVILLLIGYYFYTTDNNYFLVSAEVQRTDVADKIKKYYEDWIENEFKNILEKYDLTEEVRNCLKNDDEVTENKTELTKFINEKMQCGTYNSPYEELKEKDVFYTSSSHFYINFKLKEDSTSDIDTIVESTVTIVKSVLQVALKKDAISYQDSKNNFLDAAIAFKGDIDVYTKSFFDKLYELYQKEEEEETKPTSVENPNVIRDLQITLYNYLKLLYDRWMCGKMDEYKKQWTFNALLEKFIIIDSFYFKVGKNIPINVKKLFQRMQYSMEQNTYSLASFINDVLADHDMLFLSVQNFADLSDENMMTEMFKPIPYRKIGKVEPRTNFVCMYTYKSSTHLNVEGSEYENDAFMLSDKNDVEKNLPFLINKTIGNEGNGYIIPSFGVTFGKQYQSYFTSIQPTMESPMMTEQSLKASYLLQNEASDNSKKIAFYGQDLYTIYSNNSYTCTVEMLGCAWVQPLMYFVILNIPMFKGSYMIQQVSHSISQGRMITRFVGTRMCKTCTPFVENYVYMKDNKDGVSTLSYNGITTTNRNDNYQGITSCMYEKYLPSVASENYLNDSNIVKDFSYYTDTTLGDVGFTENTHYSLYNAICGTANQEAGSADKLGKQLVVTVILNRAASGASWKDVFDAFDGFRVTNNEDEDVKEVLVNGPKILIGKEAVSDGIPFNAYSQEELVGEIERGTRVTLTENDLSKIYMFQTIECYIKAPIHPNGRGNTIKLTKYAFTHGQHVFHYGPYATSDTSFWKYNKNASLTPLEKTLSRYTKQFGLYCAIKESAKNSRNIGIDISLTDKIYDDGNIFLITSNVKGKLSYVFDMILDSYMEYIHTLCWCMTSKDGYDELNPTKIYIKYIDPQVQKKRVIMGIFENNSLKFKLKAFDTIDGINANFLGCVSKHYNSFTKFSAECENFKPSAAESILNALHNSYTFGCVGGLTSPNYNERGSEITTIENQGLPSSIAFPIEMGNGKGEKLTYSGWYDEIRHYKNGDAKHKAIDIGTARESGLHAISIADGVVQMKVFNPNYGNPYIVLRHNITVGNKVLFTRYLHLEDLPEDEKEKRVEVNDAVLRGQPIGIVSCVNCAEYPIHLHFEMSLMEIDNKNGFSIDRFLENRIDPAKYYYFGEKKKRIYGEARLGQRI